MKKVFLFSCGLLVAFSVLLVSCEQDVDNEESSGNGCFHNCHEYVDLGLPSGTKWAACNVGATEPWEYGGYYAWGDTEEKEDDREEDFYKWYSSSGIIKYCHNSKHGVVDNKRVLDAADDVARVLWGGNWCMPTIEDFEELCNECSWNWTSLNNVDGCEITGPNGNSIFLPNAGRLGEKSLHDIIFRGYYWSKNLSEYSFDAFNLYFSVGIEGGPNKKGVSVHSREDGLTIRPVCK